MLPDIFVATDNSPYLAWQTVLFCTSAIVKLGVHPTIVMSSGDSAPLPEFEMLKRWGCEVISHEPFTQHALGPYPPRNELASLRAIGERFGHRDGTFLFCEADMVFLNKLLPKAAHGGQFYGYMDYGSEHLQTVLKLYGLQQEIPRLNRDYAIGVPYVLPYRGTGILAERWIEVLDRFPEIHWIDIMYAFGIAAASLGIAFSTVDDMCTNQCPDEATYGSILHYCYGDEFWGKRLYMTSSPFSRAADLMRYPSGTILHELGAQMKTAADFMVASGARKETVSNGV